ncbi:MAG: M48 family metallopeptidase [Verrucomicrobiae bacterium]|nr:M48 family metallopeptidase [Verrucomicrobiae bacterium]
MQTPGLLSPRGCFAAAVFSLILGLTGCAVVPETGRQQLVLLSPREEMQLGLNEFEKIKQSKPISRDAAANAMLQEVGRRIAAVAELPGAQWEFVLFDDPQTPNAFCLPGGKVGVFTGILPITKNEAGLATVVSHEVAHAVARHGAERVSQGLLFQLGGAALDVAMRNHTHQARQIVLSAYGLGGTVGVLLPYSRRQELEADYIGLLYMARAGYDPREAIEFWKRFADYNRQRGGGASIEFLSTHPVDETRIRELERLLPQALAEYYAHGWRK